VPSELFRRLGNVGSDPSVGGNGDPFRGGSGTLFANDPHDKEINISLSLQED